jgi:hypothetical protein
MKVTARSGGFRAFRSGPYAVGVAVVVALSFGLAATTSAAPALPVARSTSTTAALVKKWLAAPGPASPQFPKIEAALKALPASATAAQVAKVTAPVGGLLTPIENLLPSPYPTLEGLGTPTISEQSKGLCTGTDPSYESASGGAKLKMAGQIYKDGFHIVTDENSCFPPFTDTFSWHIGGLFQRLTALVGLDESDSTSTVLGFLGPDGKGLTFSADGRSVTSVTLMSGVPTRINISIKGDLKFVIQASSGGATVDFANDSLTSG